MTIEGRRAVTELTNNLAQCGAASIYRTTIEKMSLTDPLRRSESSKFDGPHICIAVDLKGKLKNRSYASVL